jgi:hypothetical protein
MAFDQATRLTRVQLPPMNKPTGGGLVSQVLPSTGLLARIYLLISGSVAGTLSSPNAFGFASIVSQVKVTANSGIDLISVSGPGYHYLLRQFQNLYNDPVPWTNAKSAVTATSFDISMLLELAVNQSDPVGLVMLQNEQTIVSLSVNFLADASVATGATVTATVTPIMEFFTVPRDPKDYPPLNFVFQTLEDQQAIAAAGDFTYNWPRGGTYLQTLHGCGIAQSASDLWSRARLRVNQSNIVEDVNPNTANAIYGASHFTTRPAGVVAFDFGGDAGLGMFAKARDAIDSSKLTDLATVITATQATTLYTIRRQVLQLS